MRDTGQLDTHHDERPLGEGSPFGVGAMTAADVWPGRWLHRGTAPGGVVVGVDEERDEGARRMVVECFGGEDSRQDEHRLAVTTDPLPKRDRRCLT